MVVEDLGQRPLARPAAAAPPRDRRRASPRRGGRRRSGAAPPPCARRWRASAASRLRRGRFSSSGAGLGEAAAEQLRGAAQVALIGEQGVARRAGLGGHHLEEGGDQLPVLAGRRSQPRHRLGGDHPRLIVQADRAQRADDPVTDSAGGTPRQSAVCMPTPASRATVARLRARAPPGRSPGSSGRGAEPEARRRGLIRLIRPRPASAATSSCAAHRGRRCRRRRRRPRSGRHRVDDRPRRADARAAPRRGRRLAALPRPRRPSARPRGRCPALSIEAIRLSASPA